MPYPNPGESMSGRVLITGASGALGRSVVARFLDAGDRVLAVGATQAALTELSAPGATDALAVRRVDLSSTPEVETLQHAFYARNRPTQEPIQNLRDRAPE